MKVTPDTKFSDYEKGKKEAARKHKGPVTHMTVKPAGGGKYVTEAHHENMGTSEMYQPSTVTKKAHPNLKAASKHMHAMFKEPIGDEPEGAETPQDKEEKEAGVAA